jgi:hypothetical protein
MTESGKADQGMNLYQKLVRVRSQVGALPKDKHNDKFNFDYVSASSLLSAIRPMLNEFGLFLKVQITGHKMQEKWQDTKERDRSEHLTELEIEFTWINMDKPEETLVCTWYGQGLDSGEKGVGKALTYATKYFLLTFFLVPTDADDPDAHGPEAANSSSSRTRPPAAKAPAKQGAPPAGQPAKAADKQAAAAAPATQAAAAKQPMGLEEVVDMETFKAAVRSLGIGKQGLEKAKTAANLRDYALDQLDLNALRAIYGMALVTATHKNVA